MISTEKRDCTSVTQQDIEYGLQKLGLGRGDAVEVHSSLSSFGYVQGGASTVVDALMNVVGKDGALVMSAYPVSRALPLTEEEKARGIIWKVRFLKDDFEEKTGMGVIADEFRRRPETLLGKNLHRVSHGDVMQNYTARDISIYLTLMAGYSYLAWVLDVALVCTSLRKQ